MIIHETNLSIDEYIYLSLVDYNFFIKFWPYPLLAPRHRTDADLKKRRNFCQLKYDFAFKLLHS